MVPLPWRVRSAAIRHDALHTHPTALTPPNHEVVPMAEFYQPQLLKPYSGETIPSTTAFDVWFSGLCGDETITVKLIWIDDGSTAATVVVDQTECPATADSEYNEMVYSATFASGSVISGRTYSVEITLVPPDNGGQSESMPIGCLIAV
jgi:hypothetical protein